MSKEFLEQKKKVLCRLCPNNWKSLKKSLVSVSAVSNQWIEPEKSLVSFVSKKFKESERKVWCPLCPKIFETRDKNWCHLCPQEMGEKFVVSQVSTVNEWGVAEIEIDFELQMCPQVNA